MEIREMAILGMVVMSALVIGISGFNYDDLVALKNCYPLDSCKNVAVDLPINNMRNCHCDGKCSAYGDCCLDSEYHTAGLSRNKIQRDIPCVTVNDAVTAYMKTTCIEDWDDRQVSDMCLRKSSEFDSVHQDPVASLPATSLETNVTYANYYCAICNRDSKSLVMWSVGWNCGTKLSSRNISGEFIPSNLALKNNVWGVNVDSGGKQEFIGCSDMHPVLPERLQSVVRNCIESISGCIDDWTDENVKSLCHTYTAAVYHGPISYRNIHCAMCNNVNLEQTSCKRQDLGRINNRTQPFSVLFDFSDSSGSNLVGSSSKCEKNEIWDPFFKKCRDVVCGKPNQVFYFGRCVDDSDFNEGENTDPGVTPSPSSTESGSSEPTTGMRIVFPEDKSTDESSILFPDDPRYSTTVAPLLLSTLTAVGTAVASNATEEFQICNKILLADAEFTLFDNGSLYVGNYSRVYAPDEYQLVIGGVYVCSPFSGTNKFSSAMVWVSLVGMVSSCLCLLIHLAAFFLVQDLRNLSGKNLASLCLALLAAYVTFIVNLFVDPSPTGCIILASAMYYCFLCAFCWMNATAFDIWHTFRLTKTQLRVTNGKQWHRFIFYSLYSWLLPAVAVAVVVTIDALEPKGIPKDFLPALGTQWCWFSHRKALLVFFAIPITIMIIVNCAFFIETARIIAETTSATSTSTSSRHHKHQYKMHMRLAVLMGFTWLSGTAAGYLQLEALWYIFILLNTLQGVFIFLAFTCRRKVWRVMGVTSHKLLLRGSSWISRHMGGRGAQNMELKNSTSPSTSVDGL